MTKEAQHAPAPTATGSILIYSDLRCPWAHVAVHKLIEERKERGIDEVVQIEHRCFPLEILDPEPSSIQSNNEAIAACAQLAPEAGWNSWSTDRSFWPMTSMMGFQACQAMRLQGPAALETLDSALRKAVFEDSRCISLLPEVLDIASSCEGIDVGGLEMEIWSGRPMQRIYEHLGAARSDQVVASPHVFTSDGENWVNPGVELDPNEDSVKVLEWDPDVYGRICEHAMSLREFD